MQAVVHLGFDGKHSRFAGRRVMAMAASRVGVLTLIGWESSSAPRSTCSDRHRLGKKCASLFPQPL
jgi:hypothetical protein